MNVDSWTGGCCEESSATSRRVRIPMVWPSSFSANSRTNLRNLGASQNHAERAPPPPPPPRASPATEELWAEAPAGAERRLKGAPLRQRRDLQRRAESPVQADLSEEAELRGGANHHHPVALHMGPHDTHVSKRESLIRIRHISSESRAQHQTSGACVITEQLYVQPSRTSSSEGQTAAAGYCWKSVGRCRRSQ